MEEKLQWATHKTAVNEEMIHLSVFFMYPKLQSAIQEPHTLTKS